MAWSVGGTLAAFLVFLGAFTYGWVYTVWLKTRTRWNIVIGGAAGSFAVLAGAAAAGPGIGPAAWLLAAALFLWTPPHFWALAAAKAADYGRAGVPMLPVVAPAGLWAPAIFLHVLALTAVSLAAVAFGLGPVYALLAGGGGCYFLWRSWQLLRDPSDRRRALATFHASLLQFALLAGGVILDRVLPWSG
jgi:protoheme IX farnesyltransferase